MKLTRYLLIEKKAQMAVILAAIDEFWFQYEPWPGEMAAISIKSEKEERFEAKVLAVIQAGRPNKQQIDE